MLSIYCRVANASARCLGCETATHQVGLPEQVKTNGPPLITRYQSAGEGVSARAEGVEIGGD